MNETEDNRAASQVLEDAVAHYQTETVCVEELIAVFHGRGFGLLLVIFVLPNCIPIPAPGLTSITALPLFFLGYQMVLGHDHPWLPNWISQKKFRRTQLAMLVGKASPKLKRIETLLKPRLLALSSHAGERIIGAVCLTLSGCIALPLPGAHFVPGVGILFMSLGLLSRDGVMIVVGALIGLVGFAITMGVLFFGASAAGALFG